MNKTQKLLLFLTIGLFTGGGIIAYLDPTEVGEGNLFIIGSIGIVLGFISFIGLIVSLVLTSLKK